MPENTNNNKKPFRKKTRPNPNSNPNQKNSKKFKKNNNYRRNNNKKKFSGADSVSIKYDNLLDQHLLARKKYFELYHRADPNQKAKLERVFYNTLNQLRTYEEQVSDKYKEALIKKVDGLKLDLEYSTVKELDPAHIHVSHEDDYEDPHYLEAQKEDFSSDTEESKGSIDDYKSYKGI